MFVVTDAGTHEVIGITSNPNYITQSDNGSFVLVDKRAARGVAFEGSPYNLLGEKPMDRAVGTVYLVEKDEGDAIFQSSQAQADSDALSVDHELRITMLEMGVNTDEIQ